MHWWVLCGCWWSCAGMLLFVQSLVCLGKCLRILAEHKGPDPPPQWLVHEMVHLPLCLFVHHKMDVFLSVSLSAAKWCIFQSLCLPQSGTSPCLSLCPPQNGTSPCLSLCLLQNGMSPCLSLCPPQNGTSPYQSLHLLCCILFCLLYFSNITLLCVCVFMFHRSSLQQSWSLCSVCVCIVECFEPQGNTL